MAVIDHKFDFEIGYLVKSPCRECKNRSEFPKCTDKCVLLDKIHAVLAGTVSCNRTQ